MHKSTTTTPISTTSEAAGSWRLADVIDFEYLLELDHDRPLVELERRDHDLFREQILPPAGREGTGGPIDRRLLFRQWLESRRTSFRAEQLLPGGTAVASWRVLLKWVAVVGVVLGAGAAARLLRYDGQQPVNVAAFIGWLVVVQIGLVLLAGAIVLLRKTRFLSTEASLFGALIRSLWSWLAVRLNRHAMSRFPAEQRTRLAAFLGATGQHRSLYGQVVLWPIAGSLQLFGVGFNLGALATTIALVVFSDRAFGWQSAVDFSPGQIHELTRTLAMPWSWLLANAAPTLEQVQGSRIVLKDGIKQLATGNLVSWWPFLCLSLAVYGLLPRLILWVTTVVFGRRALRQLSFNQVACDRLYERVRTARLETSGQGGESRSASSLPRQHPDGEDSSGGLPGAVFASPAVALVGAGLRQHLDLNRFSELVQKRFHLGISQTIEWSDQTEAMRHAIEQLQNVRRDIGLPTLVILEEAWQPPIAEKLGGLRALRGALGPRVKIIVTLIGRPDGSNWLTAAKPGERLVWERQIQALGDTQLRLESLIEHE